jgi:hypothetical protein
LRHGVDPETMSAGDAFMTPLEELKHLRKEVKMLRGQASTGAAAGTMPALSLLDSSVNLGSTSVMASAAGPSSGVDASKLNTRLKEMFKERINSYREAVYLLFGFKVDFLRLSAGIASSAFTVLNHYWAARRHRWIYFLRMSLEVGCRSLN